MIGGRLIKIRFLVAVLIFLSTFCAALIFITRMRNASNVSFENSVFPQRGKQVLLNRRPKAFFSKDIDGDFQIVVAVGHSVQSNVKHLGPIGRVQCRLMVIVRDENNESHLDLYELKSDGFTWNDGYDRYRSKSFRIPGSANSLILRNISCGAEEFSLSAMVDVSTPPME